jgi:hypothetical protein
VGYFSNGSEGEAYEAFYCDRCVHQLGPDGNSGCAVWFAHLLHNYDDCDNPNSILHLLIPRSKDDLDNAQCRLFYLKPGAIPLPPPDRSEPMTTLVPPA